MEAPQLRQLSEQERRTNILLQELGRPTVDPNMVPNAASSEEFIPPSRAILKDDEESISGDSDEGSAERFYGKQPPNLKLFKDGDSFADWLTAFVISLGTIPFLNYAFRYDEPVKDARWEEFYEEQTAANQRRLTTRFTRRKQYWTRSNATLQAVLMEVVKDFPAAKHLVFDLIKAKKTAMQVLTALHATFYPMNEGRKQHAITALFNAASSISDSDKPSQWVTKLETLWQQAKEAGAPIPSEELPSLLLQGLNKMPNSKIFAQVKMADFAKKGPRLSWSAIREEALQHEKISYGEETKRTPLIAQVANSACLACGKSGHSLESCFVLKKAQQMSRQDVRPGAPRHTCRQCGRKHKGRCFSPNKGKVSAYQDNNNNPKTRLYDRDDDESNKKPRGQEGETRSYGLHGNKPFHMSQQLPSSESYFKNREKKGGMSAMIAAAVQSQPYDSFIDSCCDAVYVGPQQPISCPIAISERVATAKPDSYIKIFEKGRVDDLPVRKTEEPLLKNLIGIGPLCDLGWKLTFEGNDCKITRGDEEIVVQRMGNLYGVNIGDLSKRSITSNIAMRVYSVSPEKDVELWHHRLMHRSRVDIIEWSQKNLLKGVKPLKKPGGFHAFNVCPDCAATKSSRASHKRSKTDHTDGSRDHTVSVDTFGPLATECCAEYSGCRYIQTFLNIGSRTPTSAMMRNKSEALGHLKAYSAKEFFKHYHSDGAPELISDETYTFLDDNNITHSHTNAYTPEQNAHVERIQGTLDGMSSAALHKAGLGDAWKCHAWACAIQTLKHVPTTTDRGLMSPFEYKHGRAADLSNLRTFGCRAWVHIPEEKRTKGSSLKAHEGMFVGYGDGQPGWKIYLFHDKETITSSDVVFDETSFPGKNIMSSVDALIEEREAANLEDFYHLIGKKYYDSDERDYFITTGIRELNGYIVADRQRARNQRASKKHRKRLEAPIFVRDVEQMLRTAMKLSVPFGRRKDPRIPSQSSAEFSSEDNYSSESDHDTPRRGGSSAKSGGARLGPKRRSRESPLTLDSESTSRGRVDIDDHSESAGDEENVEHHLAEDVEEYPPPLIEDEDIPQSVLQATTCNEAVHWRVAIREEVDYIDTNAWIPIEETPRKKPLRTKFVFTKKIKNGQMKYKARLVACGYNQIEGVDYNYTYSPTSRPGSLRLFCYLAVLFNMAKPRHIDVVKAYLNADIDEEILVYPPSDPNEEFFAAKQVYKLQKALYGLKQSAYLWNKLITNFLVSLGFRRHRTEQCLFSKTDRIEDRGALETNILVYVDDLIIASECILLRNHYVEEISRRFDTTDEGDLQEYLGVSIEFDYRNNIRSCKLDQTKYIRKKLKEFGMSNCKGAVTPLTRGVRFSSMETLGRIDFPYRQMLGSLIHAMNWTRPDLAYAINMLSRFAATPTLRATREITRVFQYLSSTADLQLTYTIEGSDLADMYNYRMISYTDADFAGCLDTGRSITSYLTYMGPALLAWRSRRQNIVAQSSTESEYVAMNEGYGSLLEYEHIMKHDYYLQFIDKPIMYVDNQSAIGIVVDDAALQRSRQFRVIHHRLHDAIAQHDLIILKIDSRQNHADIGTKSLDGPDHNRHLIGLGLIAPHDDDFN